MTLDYYTIYRNTGANTQQGQKIAETNSLTYTNTSVNTSINPYTYRIKTTDICNYSSPVSRPSSNIYQSGKNENDTISIVWNPYTYWNKLPSQYIIEMRDNDLLMNEVARVNGNVISFSINSLTLEITDSLCFRVIALEDSTVIDSSYSNIACIAPKSRMFVPNAFSPNGDNLNEIFKPVSIFLYNQKDNSIYDYTFEVYNRWGEKLYQTNDVNAGWDGNFKGKEVQEGIYLWRVDALGLDGVYHTYSGRVTLLR